MEALYHQTNKLLQETQQYFAKLEQALPNNVSTIEHEIQTRIDSITSNCDRLDILVFKEPVTRRQNGKIRIDQLKYDNQHLQAALRMFQDRQLRRRQEEQEREELLSRTYTRNTDRGNGETAILVDHAVNHHTSLQNSHRGMDDMLASGSTLLESLRSQRETLKGARRRLLDVANTLGLSNATMRFIERRVFQDKFILLGGMLITCLVIIIVIVYFT